MTRHYEYRRPKRAVITMDDDGIRVDVYTSTRLDWGDEIDRLRECLELGLPKLEEIYGASSAEADTIRKLLRAINTSE